MFLDCFVTWIALVNSILYICLMNRNNKWTSSSSKRKVLYSVVNALARFESLDGTFSHCNQWKGDSFRNVIYNELNDDSFFSTIFMANYLCTETKNYDKPINIWANGKYSQFSIFFTHFCEWKKRWKWMKYYVIYTGDSVKFIQALHEINTSLIIHRSVNTVAKF